jgi:peptide/nickel transport system substrate-binding protein
MTHLPSRLPRKPRALFVSAALGLCLLGCSRRDWTAPPAAPSPGAAAQAPAAEAPSGQAPAAGAGAAGFAGAGSEAASALPRGSDLDARAEDAFHPDLQPGPDGRFPARPAPVYGGRVIVHLTSIPRHLNYAIENSAVTRRMLYELTETLLLQDWETHKLVPNLASGYQREDLVVLRPEAAAKYPGARPLRVRPGGRGEAFEAPVLFGALETEGERQRLVPKTSGGSALAAPVELDPADVASVERGSVITFDLRPDARWQPAEGQGQSGPFRIDDQVFDAEDLYFSWALYSNPEVDCDEKRFQFEKISACERLGSHRVRFFAREQYYATLESLARTLTILPRHLYDLSDPDCPWHDPAATPSQQARHINEHPNNRLFVGLGPYQVTEFTDQYIEAQRFDGYFDKSRPGYFDTIRWRFVQDDSSAMTALLNEELDFFERVKTADYFGPATESEDFRARFYKGYKYQGTYGYTGWNTHRPYLADPRVRRALAHAFPFEDYLRTIYKNLARQTTGPFPVDSSAYDHSVVPLAYDLGAARGLLEEAGFIDSDGNGLIDRDGRDLELEFLFPAGNEASKNIGLRYQSELANLGIQLELISLEWTSFQDRIRRRDFDGCNSGWVPDLESDPEQIWHSRWGQPEAEGSNNSGLRDPEVDALIEAGQREIDYDRRQEHWRAIHRRIYELQPYLFLFNVPAKFAVSRRIWGLQNFAPDPGYSLRRWHFVSLEEPGTRPTLED